MVGKFGGKFRGGYFPFFRCWKKGGQIFIVFFLMAFCYQKKPNDDEIVDFMAICS